MNLTGSDRNLPGIHSITQYSADGAEIVMVQCAYEKSGLMFTVTFTSGSVAGLFMQLVAIPELMVWKPH